MLGIGVFGLSHASSDMEGYLLGGRNFSPAVVALSAGASDMSGWMLLACPAPYIFLGYQHPVPSDGG